MIVVLLAQGRPQRGQLEAVAAQAAVGGDTHRGHLSRTRLEAARLIVLRHISNRVGDRAVGKLLVDVFAQALCHQLARAHVDKRAEMLQAASTRGRVAQHQKRAVVRLDVGHRVTQVAGANAQGGTVVVGQHIVVGVVGVEVLPVECGNTVALVCTGRGHGGGRERGAGRQLVGLLCEDVILSVL